MLKTIVFIAFGGAIGTVLRYLISIFINKYWSQQFPLATFLTNIFGCFLMGLFIGYLDKNNLNHSELKWFLITGFCGGFTTFSAFGYENFSLIQQQNSFLSILYIGASIFLGVLSVWVGLFMNKLI